MDRRGSYTADRAAALSGVPWSTVHEWARGGVLVPSVSPARTKLWSYTDLIALRTIYWLRHPKPGPDGVEIPATPMSAVREALKQLSKLDLSMWEEGDHGERRPVLRVDRGGRLYIGSSEASMTASGQLHAEMLDLFSPFESEAGIRGPDLVRPRPRLRIIPGKLAGAPHVARTRLETEALAAIARRGVSAGNIYRLYPNFDRDAIDEALDLEEQLARNLEPIAAAA